ncbi:hypothetical protein [Methylobacillus flagellatus]|uniref:Uncharacterized protein n=1 Tax=Methylobacillus flagellatus (strain ATCC 51484 / DSM 6875 / VKM B-1610 / KT) TaxID=265072 RepID=Q1H268_METFK|nr:hypothetical protein [Methylobacillus flagellatus]ABE49419.1 hypothetical protein Mfla_1151 [Methylobacillus flagellatus KT]
MPGGVKYINPKGEDLEIYFPDPQAYLPVQRKLGLIEWLKWGKRDEETAPELAEFLQGGWARKDLLDAGEWKQLDTEIVSLAVHAFMEKGEDNAPLWFEVPQGHAILALIIKEHNEERVYVIISDPPLEYSWLHDGWPLLASVDQLTG